MKEQSSLHPCCFVGEVRDRLSPVHPTRCPRVRGGKKDEKERAQLPRSLPTNPFLSTALASWQGSEGGPEEGKAERAGPVNKSNVREEEKESGDRARGKGVGAQPCGADSPTCRSVFQQRSWPWNL